MPLNSAHGFSRVVSQLLFPGHLMTPPLFHGGTTAQPLPNKENAYLGPKPPSPVLKSTRLGIEILAAIIEKLLCIVRCQKPGSSTYAPLPFGSASKNGAPHPSVNLPLYLY